VLASVSQGLALSGTLSSERSDSCIRTSGQASASDLAALLIVKNFTDDTAALALPHVLQVIQVIVPLERARNLLPT
jgi:hypothetical protein